MSEETAKLGIVVVDDEPMARGSLRTLLARDPEVELLQECRNGREALEAVREHQPQILFLDIQMPGMTGFDVIAELDEDETPVVVFATAYDQYALKAFEVSAVDYLLKPFDDERFGAALERAKNRARMSTEPGMGPELSDLLDTVARKEAEDDPDPDVDLPWTKLAIHRKGRIDLLDTSEVDWVEAADQYVQVHMGADVHLMRQSMSKLEKCLDPERFYRVHRSAIVAVDGVRRLEMLGGGSARILLGSDTWVPVSRSRLAGLKQRIG